MAAIEQEPNGNVLRYRVDKIERLAEEVDNWRRHVDEERATMREQMKSNTEAVKAVSQGMETLRRTLIGFAVTVAASSIAFALAVLAASGKL